MLAGWSWERVRSPSASVAVFVSSDVARLLASRLDGTAEAPARARSATDDGPGPVDRVREQGRGVAGLDQIGLGLSTPVALDPDLTGRGLGLEASAVDPVGTGRTEVDPDRDPVWVCSRTDRIEVGTTADLDPDRTAPDPGV